MLVRVGAARANPINLLQLAAKQDSASCQQEIQVAFW